jgi:hypothetical protein
VSEGACRCGAVQFRAEGSPLITMACHCTGCQRMTGGDYSLSSLYPAERFDSGGETVLGGIKGATKHHFCTSCMSWLFTVPEGFEGFVNVRSSMFDDAREHRPFVDMWLSEALPGAESGAPRRFDTVPQEEEFGELMRAYADWDGRVKA